MYFQIKSDLREKIWKFGHFYNKKLSLGLGILQKVVINDHLL